MPRLGNAYLPENYDEEKHLLFVRNNMEGNVTLGGSDPANLIVLKRGQGIFVNEGWGTPQAFLRDPIVMQLLSRGRLIIEADDK